MKILKPIHKTFIMIAAVLCIATSALAQSDYTTQVQALKKSFDEKNSEAVKPYVSSELAFGQYPAAASVQILGQVFNNLPKLHSLEILNQKKGEAQVRYNFTALGKRESSIHFNEEGLITKLELIDNLLREQAEAQKALAEQKQAPTPGELAEKYPFKKVEFASKDGLTITGNLYDVGKDKPIILLCHQANYNKYEYADIAPKLNAMGFNALAIDQRSGGAFADHDNQTFDQAKGKGLETEFLNAEQDIDAAVNYLSKKYNQKVILWGSSYSSSLALFVGAKNPNVSAVISFSPGDYFGDEKASLSTVFNAIEKPFFVTSSKQEAETLSALMEGAEFESNQSQFIPEGTGYHGSRALWEGQKGAEEYWNAVTDFLGKIK